MFGYVLGDTLASGVGAIEPPGGLGVIKGQPLAIGTERRPACRGVPRASLPVLAEAAC